MPDYAYINARIRSMEGDLLSQEQVRELLSFRDLSSAASFMKKTAYSISFPVGAEGSEGSMSNIIDSAVRASLSGSMQKVLSMFKGDEDNLIQIFLSKWDVFNIKTLLRGKLNHAASDEVLSATVPAGSLDENMLKEIYKQPSIQATLDMLFTIGYGYVSSVVKFKNLHEGNLLQAEVGLERAYFKDMLTRVRNSGETKFIPSPLTGEGEGGGERRINRTLLEDTIRLFIDRYNLIAAVRMADGGIQTDEAMEYFIEGGKMIPLDIFRKIIKARDVSDCMSMIDSAVWKLHYTKFSGQSRITNPVLLVERWMDYEVLHHALRLHRSDPLNIGLVISYILRKSNEVINLRIILRGILYNLPQGEVEGLLIII